MKLRRVAALLFGLNLLLAGSPTATADSTPSPTPTPTASPVNELEQYKIALEQYQNEMKLRDQVQKEIAKVFITAIKLADSIAKNALRNAKTDKEIKIIRDQLQRARDEATQLRYEAISAMGEAPAEPIKPVKPMAVAPTKKSKSSKPSSTPSS